MNTHVVIMAGGIGSRFWPLSTPEYPKQFIDILGCGRTLIQLTADRFQGICPQQNFWVVTNAQYVDIVKQQIPNIPLDHILAEPAARNTAPCIAWACWRIKAEDPTANVVVTPSDAVVMNPDEFRRVISNALDFISQDITNPEHSRRIVTIGIQPTRPETGYGYVHFNANANANANANIKPVSEFKEKPNRETAERYLQDGNYLWNAGIFVWNVQTITNAIKTYKPDLAAKMDEMALGTFEPLEPLELRTKRIFPTCEKISIDFAVMEPASRQGMVYTHPADFGWTDLGNWASLHDKLTKDEHNNAVVGNVRLFECSNCVVHTEDNHRTILQGLDGYIVSEKNGQLLVCKRSEEQRIKDFSADM